MLSYLYLSAMGYPFKWAKTRGGFRAEWLGVETEYSSYKLGLTQARLLASSLAKREGQGAPSYCERNGPGSGPSRLCCYFPRLGEAFSRTALVLSHPGQVRADENPGYD